MKRKTLFSFLTVAALGLLVAGPAYACNFEWKSDAGSTTFRTPGNWNTSGICSQTDYPKTGDTVIIQSSDNDPVISNDEIFATLTIDNDGVLTVTGANTLTLSGSSHTLNGDLVLQDDDSIVKFTADATVSGNAEIVGQDNGAEVRIAAGKVLTNTMSIVGNMKIVGEAGPGDNGKLFNGSTGVIRSDVDGGIFTLAVDLADGGSCSGAVWAAIGNAGFTTQPVLKFEVSATGLTSLFYLDDCANIVIAASTIVSTTNKFTDKDGNDPPQGYVNTTSGSASAFKYKVACDTGDFIVVDEVCKLFGTECSACP